MLIIVVDVDAWRMAWLEPGKGRGSVGATVAAHGYWSCWGLCVGHGAQRVTSVCVYKRSSVYRTATLLYTLNRLKPLLSHHKSEFPIGWLL